MQVWLPKARYSEKWQVARFYERTLEQINQLPGVQSASVVNFPPLDIISPVVELSAAGPASALPDEQITAEYKLIDPEYFRTLGIPLIEGRYLADSDDDETHGVVVISKSLARALWPGDSPIGNRVVLRFPRGRDLYWVPESLNLPLSIVGVVGDINKEGLRGARSTELYLPYKQNPSRFMHLIARTAGNPLSLATPAADQIRRLDSDEPVFDVRTMNDVMSRSFSQSEISSLLLGSFSALALVIASLGIYGVVSYTVAQQRVEIGIRMALGAAKLDILRATIGRTLLVSAAGILVGLLGTIAAARILQTYIFGVMPGDRSILFLVASFVALVSILAAYLPARKAVNSDPVQAIRCE
jgi:putative ABC transport system permease protein